MNAISLKTTTLLQYIGRLTKLTLYEIASIGLNFIQCFLGKILLKAFNFISLPLLTFYISREEMGFYQLLVGGMGIFVELVTLGTRQLYGIDFFKHKMLYPKLLLMSKNLWVYLRITSLLFILLFLGLGWKINPSYIIVFFVVVLQSYLNIFNELYLKTLQFQTKFLRYNLTSLFFGALQIALVLLSVIVLKQKLIGLVVSLLVVEALQSLYYFICSKKVISLLQRIQKREKHEFKNISKLVKKSIIFVPSTLSLWLLMNIDQWMLGTMSGLESVGLYAFAGKFPLLFDYLLSSSFILVYTPFLYNKLRDNYRSGAWNTVMTACFVVIGSLLLYLFASKTTFLLNPIVSENFHPALEFIPPLVFVACIRLATHLLQLCIQFKNKIQFILWTNVAAAGSNALLNYLWIPKYGIHGCIMATVSSFILMFLMNLALHFYLIAISNDKEIVLHA